MYNQYEQIATRVLREVEEQLGHNVNIEYWKSNRPYSGRAYCKTFTVKVPHPVSDISLNTYIHELGHLIYQVKPSCLNEYKACIFALEKMRENGIKVSRKVKQHHNWYIAYSLCQALNRNLKTIPPELKPFKKYITTRKQHSINGHGDTWITERYYADISKC